MLVKILETVIIIEISKVIYFISKGRIFNWFYHDVMGWHLPNNEPQEFDGCSFHTHCKVCGKEIKRNSQGNWF